MRIDKYLKISRLIKRRSVAKEACEKGRVFINEKPAKPGSEVSIDDNILIRFGNSDLTVKVTSLKETVRKNDASDMYEVID